MSTLRFFRTTSFTSIEIGNCLLSYRLALEKKLIYYGIKDTYQVVFLEGTYALDYLSRNRIELILPDFIIIKEIY